VASAPIKVNTTLSGFYKLNNSAGYLVANPDNSITMGQDSGQSIWVINKVPGTTYYSVQNYSKSKVKAPLSYLSVEQNLQFINTNLNVNLAAKPSLWDIIKTDSGTYRIESIHKAHNGGSFTYLSGNVLVKDEPVSGWSIKTAV
jgi:hypothetical protein